MFLLFLFLKLFTYLFITYVIYKLFLFIKFVIYKRVLLPFIKKPIDLKNTGQWAVVTGCTDGIGKSFTFELAEIGMDLILISRTKKKLDDLAIQLSEKYNIKTKVVEADFTNTDKVMPYIKEELDGLDIGVLFNNVGLSTGVAPFLYCNKNETEDMIEVNLKPMIKMCSVVMPNMIKKKCGVVINMSSLSAVLPTPGVSCYGATKAFILKFSQDLNREYRKYGITVHCLTSSFVSTKMTTSSTVPWLLPSADEYVKSAIKTIGISDVTTGYISHDIFEVYSRLQLEFAKSFYIWQNGFLLGYLAKLYGVQSTATRVVKNKDELKS
ncbi:very-long-chain 3-oxoacyl-CoA reductase-like [Lycorma delicatula]|uniref:very-long-chain 3-oxoacyl-CoA reductase-like n=1 Tax=Lycorma delicatula TaxID=130591 RepID=UPI003F51793B